MKFERELTPVEVTILGIKPKEKLNQIIDGILKRINASTTAGTVESRILSLMSETTVMTTTDILKTHEAVYGKGAIRLSYLRAVLSNLHGAQLVIRSGHGKYLKAKSHAV